MELEIFEVEQGSWEWEQARVGVTTASCFKDVMTKNRKGDGRGLTSYTYMYKVASERIRNEPAEVFGSFHMDRGKEYEEEVLKLYQGQTGNAVKKIGFMKRGTVGASADGLIGDDGGVEFKTRLAHLQIQLLLGGETPEENIAQVQGNMMVSGRQWWDLVSFCPGLPLYIKRVARDDEYITELAAELVAFEAGIVDVVKQIKAKF